MTTTNHTIGEDAANGAMGEREAFQWPQMPDLPNQSFYAFDQALFTAHQMQGYANAYGEVVRAALTAEKMSADVWKAAIDHELTTIESTADSFGSAREAVNALINWHVSVALDPAVSKEAQSLIDRGAALTAEKVAGPLPDCPHAAPFRYCERCPVTPCPIGLGEK